MRDHDPAHPALQIAKLRAEMHELEGRFLRKLADLEKKIENAQKSFPDLAAEALEADKISKMRNSYMSHKRHRRQALLWILGIIGGAGAIVLGGLLAKLLHL